MKSAFLANYLTFGDCHCWHDGFDGCDSFEDFKIRMGQGNYRIIGNSDPACLFFWPKLRETYPDAKWVVIRRPLEDVMISASKALAMRPSAVIDMNHRLERLISAIHPECVVDFDDLIPERVMEIARYLGVDAGPLKRAEQLCRMNVQVEHNYLRERIKWNMDHPGKKIWEAAL